MSIYPAGVTPRIPDSHLDLFNGSAFGHLATVMADGSPQVTPVWVAVEERDGDQFVLVNSAQGRLKNRNMARRPQVAVSVQDPQRPYRYVAVRGEVVSVTTEGAEEQLEGLSQRYLGEPYPWYQPGEVRELFRIRPVRVVAADFG